jgi:hypothetical protein
MLNVMHKYVQRAGLAGLAFFAVKGLFWLVVPLIIAMSGCWE